MKIRTAITTSSSILGSLLALALTGGRASAQEAKGFALDRFDPSERGSEWFALDSLDMRGKGRPAIGLVGDYAYKPLVLYNLDHTERAALMKDQLFVHAGASLVLWDRLRVGANLPVALYQNGERSASGTTTFTPPDTTTVGDLRLSVDIRLVGEYRS